MPSDANLGKELTRLWSSIDTRPEEVYETVTDIIEEVDSLSEYTEEEAVSILGLLIDVSDVLSRLDGINKAIDFAEEYQTQKHRAETHTRLHYCWGNAHSIRRRHADTEENPWQWENDDLEQEIYHFRLALHPDGITNIETSETCRIYTNLGNALSHTGRVIEAIQCWENALTRNPDFAQARGQKGIGYYSYAQHHYDKGHFVCLLKAAHHHLEKAVQSESLYPAMQNQFTETKEAIEQILTPDALASDLEFEEYSLGDSVEEQAYRTWCLNQRLFLNTLNDIGPYSVAAQDVLHLAGVSGRDSNKIISCIGFYNQMKQEYISARYFLYKGIHADEPHFADKDTHLENTLDYPDYSIHAENVRIALRMAYSLFDKIATFLQYYYDLNYIAGHHLNFGNVWYKSRGKNALASEFEDKENWPLRGLFWLSKDLDYFSALYVEGSLDPGAKELRDIRNDLEHNYLKLHQQFWTGADKNQNRLIDELATSLSRDDFEEKALTTLQKARAALIYLSLAVRWEEEQKDDTLRAPLHLGRWKDNWKR